MRMHRRWVVGLQLLLAVPAVGRSQQPAPGKAGQKPQEQTTGAKEDTQHRQTKPEGTTTASLPKLSHYHQSVATQQRGEGEQEAPLDWWLVRLTGGLVLVGIGQFFLFWWQLVLIRRSVEDAKGAAVAARLGAEAAKKSADATEESVATIKDTARRELRAYLTAETGTFIQQNTSIGMRFEWQPRITNTGRTPAFKVTVLAKVDLLPYPLVRGYDFFIPEGANPSRTTIGASQQITAARSFQRLFADAEIAHFQSIEPGSAVYIYGCATYFDIYETKHTTTFCQYAIWAGSKVVAGVMTEENNDAD